MIILNSVNDFKSLLIKQVLDYKELTYVNLEYAENNHIEYDFNSTSIIYIDSPVNDSERMITKKMSNILKSKEIDNKKEDNIYISENIKSGFEEIKMGKNKKCLTKTDEGEDVLEEEFDEEYENTLTYQDFSDNKELILTDPYIIIRFLEDLCDTPSLYPTYMDKRYLIYQFEKRFLHDIFELFFEFERLLLVSCGNANSYNFKHLINETDNLLKNNHVKGKFNKILEIIEIKIIPFVEQKENDKYFLSNKINSIEIILFTLIKRLFQYKLLSSSNINKLLLMKYNEVEKCFNKKDKEHQVVNYKTISFKQHYK